MKICGIDENGFGPLMGPLVITATFMNSEIPFNSFPEIKDSKLFFLSGRRKSYEKLEEFAISIYFILTSKLPENPVDILNKFCLPFKCEKKENICMEKLPKSFLWGEPENTFEKKKIFIEFMKGKIEDVKVSVICPYNFNKLIDKGNSKFMINLSEFCNLIKKSDRDTKIFAGKIGSLKYYSKYLRYFFPDFTVSVVKEDEKNSIYIVKKEKKVFNLGFYVDVEEISLSAAISSIIGKYIREIFMESIRRKTGIDEEVSGYRDTRTKKAIGNINFDKVKKECLIRKK